MLGIGAKFYNIFNFPYQRTTIKETLLKGVFV